MKPTLPCSFRDLLVNFAPHFTAPSFENFMALVMGWVVCVGRHTVTRVIQFGGNPRARHHSVFYRFLSRAVWTLDSVNAVLSRLVLAVIPGSVVYALVDDTLCRKTGPHIWGAGMHHDPLNSSQGHLGKRHAAFAFGHSWVVLSLWVAVPWNKERGVALPVAFRLYRTKKLCPASEYKKRTELAAQLITWLVSLVPAGRRVVVLGDAEYACGPVVKALPQGIDFIGPMDMEAALYAQPERRPGRGRPAKKGARLPSPSAVARDASTPWETSTVSLYGRRVTLQLKTWTCLWYTVAATRLVRVVVTSDPKGRIAQRAFFSTDASSTASDILETFSRRWAQEVMFHEVKELGLEDPQNGWWRRAAGSPRPPKKAGPQADAVRGESAVRRTAPLAFLAYSLVTLWYLQHGSAAQEVTAARGRAPWYRHKKEPAFADMLSAARTTLWQARFSEPCAAAGPQAKITEYLTGLLAAA